MKKIASLILLLAAFPVFGQNAAAVRARLLVRADSLTRLMRYDEAASQLAALLEDEPGDMEVLAQLANVHFMAGNSTDAVRCYRLLARQRPREPFYKIREAQVCYRLSEYADAAAAGKSALAAAESPALLVLIGNAFNKLQQNDSALVYYRRALRMNPANSSAVGNLASLLLERKAYPAVIAVCKTYLDTVHFQMHGPAVIFRGGRITPALRDSVSFTCDVSPEKALPVLQTRGVAECLMKEYATSVRTFEALLAAGDESYGTHYYLGLNYMETSPWLAADEFSAAYAIDSSDVNLVLNYARSLIYHKSRPGELNPESRRLFDRALAMLEPDHKKVFSVLYNYAASYHKLEDYAASIPLYKAAYEQDADAISCLSNIGYCYERLEDWKNAERWYKKYLEVGKPGSSGHDYVLQALKYVEAQRFMEE